jgi:hypothetical protein
MSAVTGLPDGRKRLMLRLATATSLGSEMKPNCWPGKSRGPVYAWLEVVKQSWRRCVRALNPYVARVAACRQASTAAGDRPRNSRS